MRFMRLRGHEVVMVSSVGSEVSEITTYEGVPHKSFVLTRRITPLRDLITIFQLAWWIRKHQFDIVHSHTPKAGLVAMTASWIARVPVRLHTVAGIPWILSVGTRRRLLKTMERTTYKFASKVYFNSLALSEFAYEEQLIKPSKFKVIGNGSSNGIDIDYFSKENVKTSKPDLKKALGISEKDFVFCYVGRVVSDKGMNELSEAFRNVTACFKDCHLLLVGPLEQELDPILPKSLEFFETSPQVQLMGYKSDIRPFLKAADVLVFPSHREGFPNVPLQAGAMGLASIVTNINGCNEIIKDGVNGLIVDAKNVNSLENGMKRMLNEKGLAITLGNQSRKMIIERFDQELIWKELENEYIQLSDFANDL